jgi:hypothetical protein
MAKNGKDEPQTGTEQAAQITPTKLQALLKAAKTAYQDGRAAAGIIGKKIATAAEHDHLHVKAFATLRAMDRMEPEKAAEYWDVLQYYVENSRVGEKIKSAPRLGLGDDREAEEDGASSKVTPIRGRSGASASAPAE